MLDHRPGRYNPDVDDRLDRSGFLCWQRTYYGANLPRLIHVKSRHDPDAPLLPRQCIPTR